jgi:hypothetical protein
VNRSRSTQVLFWGIRDYRWHLLTPVVIALVLYCIRLKDEISTTNPQLQYAVRIAVITAVYFFLNGKRMEHTVRERY